VPRDGSLLVLASASPRRAELLRAAGIPFTVRPADLDESVLAGESPEAYVRRLAEAKAEAAAAYVGPTFVLSADTVVVVDDVILGKPVDAADAARMLRLLSDRTHEVLTGVCLNGHNGRRDLRVERTMVEFSRLGDADIAWYISTGEPMDKAGAYAIQGGASRYVTRIEGSYSNVVGLPVALVWQMLRDAGFEPRDGLS
jgi:septum formation protein